MPALYKRKVRRLPWNCSKGSPHNSRMKLFLGPAGVTTGGKCEWEETCGVRGKFMTCAWLKHIKTLVSFSPLKLVGLESTKGGEPRWCHRRYRPDWSNQVAQSRLDLKISNKIMQLGTVLQLEKSDITPFMEWQAYLSPCITDLWPEGFKCRDYIGIIDQQTALEDDHQRWEFSGGGTPCR